MAFWVILFIVGFVVTTTLALRREDRGVHRACHGGAAWPPDDVSHRGAHVARDAVIDPVPPGIQPVVGAAGEPVRDAERELTGVGSL